MHLRHALLVLALAGCSVADADLAASSGLLSIKLEASTDTLGTRTTQLTGDIKLGYTSPDLVALEVQNNGTTVYSTTYTATKGLTIPVDVLIAPLSEGANALTVVATYGGDVTSTTVNVALPAGIQALSLTAPATPDVLETTVSGSATLGWTSDLPATVQVWVEGSLAATEVMPGDSTSVAFDIPVQLPHAGANEVVVTLDYGASHGSASERVTVPENLQGLTMSPPTPAVGVFETQVSGTVDVGYRSDRPANLEILADGRVVSTQALDVSTTTSVAYDETVPLSHTGPTELVARVTYDDAERSVSASVTMEPPSPLLSFPNWNLNYVESVSMTATGEIDVLTPPGWLVAGLNTSTDGGLTWTPAMRTGGGAWAVTVENPDFDQELLVDTVVTHRGIPVTWRDDDVIPVQPISECGGVNGGNIMQPTSDLVRDNNVEVRSLLGYYGDPDAGHVFTIALRADADGQGIIEVVGGTLNQGYLALDTEFDVSEYKCGNNGCSQDYELEVYFNGNSICRNNTFGQVSEL